MLMKNFGRPDPEINSHHATEIRPRFVLVSLNLAIQHENAVILSRTLELAMSLYSQGKSDKVYLAYQINKILGNFICLSLIVQIIF